MKTPAAFTPADFERSVHSVCPSSTPNFDRRECPDRLVGRISQLTDLRDWSSVAQALPERCSEVQCILLVLESPHIDEYGSRQPYTPWPANGVTGRHIRKRVRLLIPEGWNHANPLLHLINAVPYQCSLGKSTRCYRSEVFREAWDHGAKVYFQERLLQAYRPGDLIVNACTVGKPARSLRADVETAINEVLPYSLRARREHPFRWMSDEAVHRSW